MQFGERMYVTVPNFMRIGQTVAEIRPFFDFKMAVVRSL